MSNADIQQGGQKRARKAPVAGHRKERFRKAVQLDRLDQKPRCQLVLYDDGRKDGQPGIFARKKAQHGHFVHFGCNGGHHAKADDQRIEGLAQRGLPPIPPRLRPGLIRRSMRSCKGRQSGRISTGWPVC